MVRSVLLMLIGATIVLIAPPPQPAAAEEGQITGNVPGVGGIALVVRRSRRPRRKADLGRRVGR